MVSGRGTAPQGPGLRAPSARTGSRAGRRGPIAPATITQPRLNTANANRCSLGPTIAQQQARDEEPVVQALVGGEHLRLRGELAARAEGSTRRGGVPPEHLEQHDVDVDQGHEARQDQGVDGAHALMSTASRQGEQDLADVAPPRAAARGRGISEWMPRHHHRAHLTCLDERPHVPRTAATL